MFLALFRFYAAHFFQLLFGVFISILGGTSGVDVLQYFMPAIEQ